MEDSEECTCNEEYIEPHVCPFRSEIYGDNENLCQCCEISESNCRDDI